MIPIDSVEKVTGIDFFPSLPDSIENPMEAYVNDGSWSFKARYAQQSLERECFIFTVKKRNHN